MAYQKKLEGINGNIRVRMAPSPTGSLHIGTARTTLFVWLFARSHGGTFILRIEDTDKERSKKEYEKNILDGLCWLGLDWDEGPDIGGEFGPYRQSERTTHYKKALQKLLKNDKAYYCFCSKETLEAQKQDVEARGEIWKYPGTCRSLSKDEVSANLKQKKPSVIRIRMPNKKVSFKDLIKGESTFDLSLFGDIVIAKGLDEPLYNFAVVVDDHEMKISHVIRGEDHYSNTPKQMVIYEALGWKPPLFAHLPLILGQDKSKLSKRHGATTSIDDYREQGYLPEAMINFIVLLGWHPSGDREIFSLNDLQQEFTLERIQKTGATFNPQKLDWLNNHYLREKPIQEVVEFLLPFLEKEKILFRKPESRLTRAEESFINKDGEQFDRSYLQKAVAAAMEKSKSLSEIIEMSKMFFEEPEYETNLLIWKEMSAKEVLDIMKKAEKALNLIAAGVFKQENIDVALSSLYTNDKGIVLWPMRAALSGGRVSPSPMVIAEILGKSKTMARIKKGITKLSCPPNF